mmetsp:Transcript_22268/g.32532  ORF Transcript_22268/g.32532 Transcript_22268/m.32532 type:complete len:246 (-) Transcript_22268:88-825(-)|eukprot:CAMPEP_0197246564 /NCGR_PEP_ID=MMETSP1429-20130617/15670_1 /TAXON_ID=49237 /ORGANISM="Chaetoceros  sp., Strain UNC1202" /LENGTH=245 /DNA_ID=CAMNT_0042707253 /DNA_START=78 /DNA_END=815 /DNA_ORIENTATION=-
MKTVLFASLLLAFLSYHAATVEAKINRNADHGHNGKLKPYSPGPFHMKLGKKDEVDLEKGNPVMKQLPADDPADKLGGKAICVQDVKAPKNAVWNQILDLDKYKGKVAKLKECKNYTVKKNFDGSINIKTKMVIGVMPGYAYENYYDHTYRPDKDSVTWQLDYDKTSDFDDVAGHWHVEDHPKKEGHSRVFYACDLKFKNSLPKPIMNFLQKTALKQATAWVKKESEANPDAEIPAQFRRFGRDL